MSIERKIAVEGVPSCLLCGAAPVNLYEGLRDRLFGAPGEWNLCKCIECGLVCLNPRPIPAELGKAYKNYFTHAPRRNGRAGRWAATTRRLMYSAYMKYTSEENLLSAQLGRILAWAPIIREIKRLANHGRLLDIGCGDGFFLSIMRDAGWQVAGVEPDSAAAEVAKNLYSLNVFPGPLQSTGFSEESFDVITLNHVIEHVYDPAALLADCRRMLKPDGIMVIATPNIESWGYRKFEQHWVQLDPPRHLYLFSAGTLRAFCGRAGLKVDALRTTTRNAGWIHSTGETIKRKGDLRPSDTTAWARLRGLRFQIRESNALRTSPMIGEELVTVVSPD